MAERALIGFALADGLHGGDAARGAVRGEMALTGAAFFGDGFERTGGVLVCDAVEAAEGACGAQEFAVAGVEAEILGL